MNVICSSCGGSGEVVCHGPENLEDCPRCHGTGVKECPICHGSGMVDND